MKALSDSSFSKAETISYNSRRVSVVLDYLNKKFEKGVSLSEAAKLVAISEVAFCPFFKLRTGKTFVDTLNEVRLGRCIIDVY